MSEHSQKTPFIKASSQDQYGKIPLKSWVGKVVSYEAQKDQIEEGWGWRYKVRILGDDSNSQNVADEELSYAICLLPTTAGSGAAYKLRSVRVSQGDMVYGIYGGDGPRLIIGVFPRTALTDTTSGNFGTLSGFYGDLEDTGILDGEYNEQIGPATPGATALDPKEWTKATATNPSEKVKEIVPKVKKKENGEFEEITEEVTEKNDVKNTAGKVNDAWKPGDNLNTATMEYLEESFEKGELPPETWEAALKQAEEQGIVGYEKYVVKTKIQEEVIPKKVEYKKTFVEAVNQAKNPPFDSWERAELIKLADNNKAKLLSNGKISISRETGITFQERTNILKEIRSIEGSLQYRAEVDPTQTIQVGDNAPQNLQQSIISDSELAKTRDRLLYLEEKLQFIEDGGVVSYIGEFTG